MALVSGGVVALGRVCRHADKVLETELFLSQYDLNGKLRWRRQVSCCPGRDDHDAKLANDEAGNLLITSSSHNAKASDHGSGVDFWLRSTIPTET